jgi:hypothetical protein
MATKVSTLVIFDSISGQDTDSSDQMNGSILANQGFINQFSDGDTDILDAQWVSAWGGMFAAALFLAQVGMVFINDRFGRRIGLWVTWCIMAGVRIDLNLPPTRATY